MDGIFVDPEDWRSNQNSTSYLHSFMRVKKIVCGLCGKKARAGYHLSTRYGRRVTQTDWSTFDPALALLSLEHHRMDKLGEEFDLAFDTDEDMHWFVNRCCVAKVRRECFDLGFKIDYDVYDGVQTWRLAKRRKKSTKTKIADLEKKLKDLSKEEPKPALE
uniref:Uncharacterized protein n=1 Tax=uncultured marine thaumarchaeote KM3_86_G02 TaxID=1456323 RepID=A0A075HSW7_9ARCH|nr:hypothetical protein [uncultured marine thaumarchaeote KM3_86_G02]